MNHCHDRGRAICATGEVGQSCGVRVQLSSTATSTIPGHGRSLRRRLVFAPVIFVALSTKMATCKPGRAFMTSSTAAARKAHTSRDRRRRFEVIPEVQRRLRFRHSPSTPGEESLRPCQGCQCGARASDIIDQSVSVWGRSGYRADLLVDHLCLVPKVGSFASSYTIARPGILPRATRRVNSRANIHVNRLL